MKREQASGTAVLIATSLVLMHRHPEYAGLVSAKTADLCASFIEACSQTPRSLLNLVRHRWFQHAVSLIEYRGRSYEFLIRQIYARWICLRLTCHSLPEN